MPIGKKKTALTDANRKKENSFNRCQSRNSTIKRFGFPNDATDCILRIRSLTILFDFAHFDKCEHHILPRTLFFFQNRILSVISLTDFWSLTFLSTSPISNKMWASFVPDIADRTFIIWTQRESTQRRKSRPTTRSYSDVELRKTHQVTKSKQWR